MPGHGPASPGLRSALDARAAHPGCCRWVYQPEPLGAQWDLKLKAKKRQKYHCCNPNPGPSGICLWVVSARLAISGNMKK